MIEVTTQTQRSDHKAD